MVFNRGFIVASGTAPLITFLAMLRNAVAAQRIKPPVDLDAAEDAGVEGRTIFVVFFQQPQRFSLSPRDSG